MRKIQTSRCPPWLGLVAIVVSVLIVAAIFLVSGERGPRWPAWGGAAVFLLAGIQILRVTLGGASPHSRGSSVLAALICTAFAALFGFVASEIFSGSSRVKTKHPTLAKIHIVIILCIVGFLLARAVYHALFPPDHDDAAS